MALSNYERVGKAVQLLAEGLAPFVDRECRAKFGDDWARRRQAYGDSGRGSAPRRVNPGDAQFLLKVVWVEWRAVFGKKLSRSDRSYVLEFQEVRNSWAHNDDFSTDDALRALDTARRLLESVSAGAQANKVGKLHQDLLRQKCEQMPGAHRKAVRPDPGLPAGREVVTPTTTSPPAAPIRPSSPPHQVWRGEAAGEYGDPTEFFGRTFLVQVNSKGYDTIMNNHHYENLKWRSKNKKGNEHQGTVESGDRIVLYCTSTVPNEIHKKLLAFSAVVSSVSNDRTTFKVGEPQFFNNPLKLMDIRECVKQGKLDKCFDYCGKQWFNITKLEPTAVKQLFDLVEP